MSKQPAKSRRPAFPRPAVFLPNSDGGHFQQEDGHEGVTIRDYFARGALPAVIAAHIQLGSDVNQESIAGECFELADAMIAVRDVADPCVAIEELAAAAARAQCACTDAERDTGHKPGCWMPELIDAIAEALSVAHAE